MGNSRTIVFSTEFGLYLIEHYGRDIASDGTFRSSPMYFKQIYTVNVMIDRVAVPAVYALTQTKDENTYRTILESIRNRLPNWYPERVMSDFERSAFQAVQDIFPNADFSGCLFHMAQAFWRRIQVLPGLLELYQIKNHPSRTREKLSCLQVIYFLFLIFSMNKYFFWIL